MSAESRITRGREKLPGLLKELRDDSSRKKFDHGLEEHLPSLCGAKIANTSDTSHAHFIASLPGTMRNSQDLVGGG